MTSHKLIYIIKYIFIYITYFFNIFCIYYFLEVSYNIYRKKYIYYCFFITCEYNNKGKMIA